MMRHPDRSHNLALSPDVAVRWWGASKNLDIDWRVPASDDGRPLLRVSGILTRDEAIALYQFLSEILGYELGEEE